MGPFPHPDGHDFPQSVGEVVLGVTAEGDDVVVDMTILLCGSLHTHLDTSLPSGGGHIINAPRRSNFVAIITSVSYRCTIIDGVGIMKHMVHGVAAAAAISISGLVGSAAPVQAYQVDCAILLCLAGGWPASAPCAHARAVFIRRITPWPVEPPLQIWRCPMGASFNEPAPLSPIERLYDIAFRDPTSLEQEPAPLPLVRVQTDDQTDIDISDDAFDFVRSIRVYHIQYRQNENRDGNCNRSDSTRLGSYGLQGDYRWTRSNVAEVPIASQLTIPNGCRSYFYRSVFVHWRDYAGNYGSEEVRY